METRYRMVVGETGNEQGHIVSTNAKTEREVRTILRRELAQYHGDGWGRIEIDIYGDGRWCKVEW